MRRNKYGDRASPCCSPRFQAIRGPGHPFTMTAYREVERSMWIQEHHWSGKPLAARTCSRLDHETESNALAKSNFRTIVGHPRR
jgi:hypothetical protein